MFSNTAASIPWEEIGFLIGGFLVLSPAFIDVSIFPNFLRIIIGTIAKHQGRALPNLLGILAAFAFPAGLAILSMLAYSFIKYK